MAEADGEVEAATSLDAFYGGRLLLRQPVRGHRSGTDAVLLAAAVPPDFAGLVFDVGSGVGAAGLGVAIGRPGARVELIDNDPAVLALAAANIAAGGLEARVRICAADILSSAGRREAGLVGRADLVISNPPFYDPRRVRVSPDPGRRAAHVGEVGGVAAWAAACLAIAAPKGEVILIHRAEAVPALLSALDGRAAVTLLPVQSRAGQDATRVLVRAAKASRAPFRLAPPLILHGVDGFTPEAERLHRGEATLSW